MRVDFDCDVFVAGAGIAGLTACIALSKTGLSIGCCDPVQTFEPDNSIKEKDRRVSALFFNNIQFLNRLGLEYFFSENGIEFSQLEVVDTSSQIRKRVMFDAREIGKSTLGTFVLNALMEKALLEEIKKSSRIHCFREASIKNIRSQSKNLYLTLGDRTKISTRLLVAADGKFSSVREILNIRVQSIDIPQTIASFDVMHKIPHENRSVEIHQKGGPFTLVPNPINSEEKMSSVVWMDNTQRFSNLMNSDPKTLGKLATARSMEILGELTICSEPKLWPSKFQIVEKLIGDRVVFIAEAAHAIPPIGAQGLNLSMGDIALLSSLVAKGEKDLGQRDLIKQYQRKRYPETLIQMGGIMALNAFSMANLSIGSELRRLGLVGISAVPAVKKAVIQYGLGKHSQSKFI